MCAVPHLEGRCDGGQRASEGAEGYADSVCDQATEALAVGYQVLYYVGIGARREAGHARCDCGGCVDARWSVVALSTVRPCMMADVNLSHVLRSMGSVECAPSALCFFFCVGGRDCWEQMPLCGCTKWSL